MGMNYSNPADWVYMLAWIQIFGLKLLLTATDGLHWGRVPVTARKRWFALTCGMAIIWIPYLSVWLGFGHSPLDLWYGAAEWWHLGVQYPWWISLPAYAIAIAGWWLLLSPIQAVLATILTLRQQHREQVNALLHARARATVAQIEEWLE